jgi:G3E family GTPase
MAEPTSVVTSAASRTPTTVFTGFLGSGKTTIISHLIDHLQANGQQVVFIKNEVGSEDLDAKLMAGKNIQTQTLLNGCICCTLVGPFLTAIDELIATYHPDRILIESAGTADPASLALMVSQHASLERDGVISIIDVVNFDGYDDISLVARRQAELTDLLVFNKVELVDEQRKHAVVGYVRELNEFAPIVEAPGGVLNPNVAFGLHTREVEELLVVKEAVERRTEKEHGSDEHHDHESTDGISATTITTEREFTTAEFEHWWQQLPKNIFRVKGIVKFADVGWKVVNGVFKRYTLSEVPASIQPTETKLICVGYEMDPTVLSSPRPSLQS